MPGVPALRWKHQKDGLLKNPTFDPSHGDGGWYTLRMSDVKWGTITHADGYVGTKSAKLTKTELTSEEGICQDVHLSAGTKSPFDAGD